MEKKEKKEKIQVNSLIHFNKKFPSEKICREKFREYREKNGITCPHCGCTGHYYISSIQKFQCKNCGHRQGLRANTVMHYSKLPFRYWFIAMHYITSTKNAFSAAEIQRQLGHEYYRPIWNMMQKIRASLGIINSKVVLKENVELDECYITTKIQKDLPKLNKKGEPYKHKKPYTLTKTKCIIACEALPVEQTEKQAKKYKLKYSCGNLRMIVVPDFKAETVANTLEDKIEHSAIIRSDGTHCHSELPYIFKKYHGEVIDPEELSKKLPFVHIAIGNLKALIRNVHHSVERPFLQLYVNEFVWKFNHRHIKNMFDAMMGSLTQIKGTPNFKNCMAS